VKKEIIVESIIRHLPPESVLTLADQVHYLPGQIVSKTLAQNPAVSLTLFAFAAGEEISTHESSGDALVTALDGRGEITIAGQSYILKAGESILMPAKIPHAVMALEPFKMLLTVIFPSN
jgi:quercetin dioxygenase-like cupin family protein